MERICRAAEQSPLVLEFIADREGYQQMWAQGLAGGILTPR